MGKEKNRQTIPPPDTYVQIHRKDWCLLEGGGWVGGGMGKVDKGD